MAALSNALPSQPRRVPQPPAVIGWISSHASPLSLLAYLALAGLLSFRAWSSPAARAVSNPLDVSLVLWFLRWVPFALSHGWNPLLSTHVDAPAGINLMWNPSIVLPAFLLTPITLVLGPMLALNTMNTLAPTLSAWCAYFCFRRFVSTPFAAAVGGLLYGFSPFVMAHSIGHPQLAIACVPPLMMLALEEILIRQRRGPVASGAALGLLAAAQLLISEEILVIVSITGSFGVLLLMLLHRDQVARRVAHAARTLLVAGGVFAALVAIPVAVQFFGSRQPLHGFQPTIFYGADLANFVAPTRLQLLAPERLTALSSSFRGGLTEDDAYLGLPLIALAWYMLRRSRFRALVRWLLLMTAVVAVLALGQRLHVLGKISDIPLPWAIFDSLPLVGHILPLRFMGLAFLFLGLVVALFIEEAALASRRERVFRILVTALVLACLLPRPLPTVAVSVPPFFQGTAVQQIPEGSVVLVAPFAGSTSSQAMAWQVAAGMRFRMPEGYLYSATGLNPPPSDLQTAMLAIQVDGTVLSPSSVERGLILDDLRQLDVGTVIIGPMAHQDAMLAFFTDVLGRTPSAIGGVYLWSTSDAWQR